MVAFFSRLLFYWTTEKNRQRNISPEQEGLKKSEASVCVVSCDERARGVHNELPPAGFPRECFASSFDPTVDGTVMAQFKSILVPGMAQLVVFRCFRWCVV